MIDFGPHAGFIVAAYGLAAAVLVGLLVWVIGEGRRQTRRLAALEARGLRRAGAGEPR